MEDETPDLAALDALAAARLEDHHAATRELDGFTRLLEERMAGHDEPPQPLEQERIRELAARTEVTLRAALAAKAARDGAYEEQAALLPPSPPVFESDEQREEWRELLIEQRAEAFRRLSEAMAELKSLPRAPSVDDSMTVDELIAAIDGDTARSRRVDLIVEATDAQKDFDRADAGLAALDDGEG